MSTAEHEGEIARGAAPGGGRLGRDPGEARIEVPQERGQKGVGGLRGGDVAQAEFAGEAILQGAPEALDAAFGLGGARRDIANPEVVQDAAEVRGVLGPAQLFVEAPMGVIADEDVDAIAIEGERQAILREQLLEDDGVAVQILRGTEVQGQHGVGRVVDGAVQAHRGPAGAEPGKGTGIDLDELPQARLRRAAMPMHAGPPPVLGGQAQGAAPPPHGLAADP